MTNEEAIRELQNIVSYDIDIQRGKDKYDALDRAIKALEQDSCDDDCVSRQAVINAIANTCFWLSAGDWNELMECINSLSSITPQPKTGHWIEKRYVGNDKYDFECSVCHIIDTHSKSIKVKHVKYCWNCGARMDIENDE